jgi:hypothetical protein
MWKPPVRRPSPTGRGWARPASGSGWNSARALRGWAAGRAALARDAAAGNVAVLRIDFPDGVVPAGSAITIDAGDQQVGVRALGPAAMGDTQLQTAGTLALLRGAAVARAGVGRILAAHRTGAGTQSGYLIPREALVRVDGALCAYRCQGRTASSA